MKNIFLIGIIYLLIIATSCARKCIVIEGHFKLNLNKENLIGKCTSIISNDTLANHISEKFDRKYKIMYCPILMFENKKGIYQYWELKTPLKTDNFFVYDGSNISYFNNLNDSVKLLLEKKSISKFDIKKLVDKINICKKYNEKTSGNF